MANWRGEAAQRLADFLRRGRQVDPPAPPSGGDFLPAPVPDGPPAAPQGTIVWGEDFAPTPGAPRAAAGDAGQAAAAAPAATPAPPAPSGGGFSFMPMSSGRRAVRTAEKQMAAYQKNPTTRTRDRLDTALRELNDIQGQGRLRHLDDIERTQAIRQALSQADDPITRSMVGRYGNIGGQAAPRTLDEVGEEVSDLRRRWSEASTDQERMRVAADFQELRAAQPSEFATDTIKNQAKPLREGVDELTRRMISSAVGAENEVVLRAANEALPRTFIERYGRPAAVTGMGLGAAYGLDRVLNGGNGLFSLGEGVDIGGPEGWVPYDMRDPAAGGGMSSDVRAAPGAPEGEDRGITAMLLGPQGNDLSFGDMAAPADDSQRRASVMRGIRASAEAAASGDPAAQADLEFQVSQARALGALTDEEIDAAMFDLDQPIEALQSPADLSAFDPGAMSMGEVIDEGEMLPLDPMIPDDMTPSMPAMGGVSEAGRRGMPLDGNFAMPDAMGAPVAPGMPDAGVMSPDMAGDPIIDTPGGTVIDEAVPEDLYTDISYEDPANEQAYQALEEQFDPTDVARFVQSLNVVTETANIADAFGAGVNPDMLSPETAIPAIAEQSGLSEEQVATMIGASGIAGGVGLAKFASWASRFSVPGAAATATGSMTNTQGSDQPYMIASRARGMWDPAFAQEIGMNIPAFMRTEPPPEVASGEVDPQTWMMMQMQQIAGDRGIDPAAAGIPQFSDPDQVDQFINGDVPGGAPQEQPGVIAEAPFPATNDRYSPGVPAEMAQAPLAGAFDVPPSNPRMPQGELDALLAAQGGPTGEGTDLPVTLAQFEEIEQQVERMDPTGERGLQEALQDPLFFPALEMMRTEGADGETSAGINFLMDRFGYSRDEALLLADTAGVGGLALGGAALGAGAVRRPWRTAKLTGKAGLAALAAGGLYEGFNSLRENFEMPDMADVGPGGVAAGAAATGASVPFLQRIIRNPRPAALLAGAAGLGMNVWDRFQDAQAGDDASAGAVVEDDTAPRVRPDETTPEEVADSLIQDTPENGAANRQAAAGEASAGGGAATGGGQSGLNDAARSAGTAAGQVAGDALAGAMNPETSPAPREDEYRGPFKGFFGGMSEDERRNFGRALISGGGALATTPTDFLTGLSAGFSAFGETLAGEQDAQYVRDRQEGLDERAARMEDAELQSRLLSDQVIRDENARAAEVHSERWLRGGENDTAAPAAIQTYEYYVEELMENPFMLSAAFGSDSEEDVAYLANIRDAQAVIEDSGAPQEQKRQAMRVLRQYAELAVLRMQPRAADVFDNEDFSF